MAGWDFSTPKFDSELLKDCLIDLVQLVLGAISLFDCACFFRNNYQIMYKFTNVISMYKYLSLVHLINLDIYLYCERAELVVVSKEASTVRNA